MRKIFLDCGAHDGCSVKMFVNTFSDYRDYEIYSFECNQERFQELLKTGEKLKLQKFYPINKAVWISNGRKLFDGWQFVETETIDDKQGVETLDLSEFILENFNKEDYIILKFDIEGAEYRVVSKMDVDGSLSFISKAYGELHGPKKGYTVEDNNELLDKLYKYNLKLFNWDALEGTYEETEIVPLNSKDSFNNHSSSNVGHSYKKFYGTNNILHSK